VTTTQTLTLTFADQVPLVNLNATPSSPIAEGVSVTLIASVVPPANSTVMPEGKVTFLDGNVSVPLENLEMSERREGNYFPSTVHGECYSPTGPRG
jgi:hypothetical protein